MLRDLAPATLGAESGGNPRAFSFPRPRKTSITKPESHGRKTRDATRDRAPTSPSHSRGKRAQEGHKDQNQKTTTDEEENIPSDAPCSIRPWRSQRRKNLQRLIVLKLRKHETVPQRELRLNQARGRRTKQPRQTNEQQGKDLDKKRHSTHEPCISAVLRSVHCPCKNDNLWDKCGLKQFKQMDKIDMLKTQRK